MRQVYGFATVNIVAGHSESPEGGLFSSRDLSSVESLIVESKWDDQPEGNYLLWDELALQQDFESAPLTQRGWVFQERLLAPRILQFVAVWERLIIQYSQTELTYGEDKLVALSGVAKLFQQTFKDRYLAGMWWSTFPRLLCWRRGWEKEATVRPDYRAPSWSWASIDGPIHFTARIPAMFYTLLLEEYLVEVVDANVVPVGNDEMAQVQGGRMTVKARLHSLKVISQQEKRVTFEIDGKGQECGEGTFILDATLQEEEELQDQQLWIMPWNGRGTFE
ncbi:hypothetical protein CEP53_006959 [Fusarium sp. AF-6]|nr:hypothetical protein CEP53_006959 [Fusarium sp. AF-6]